MTLRSHAMHPTFIHSMQTFPQPAAAQKHSSHSAGHRFNHFHINVCTQLISLRDEHFLGDAFDVLRFHMYKLQTYSGKHLCAAHSIEESHAMTTPSIFCFFICTNPNQTLIQGSRGNLQLPRAKKEIN